ncbi:MAG: nitroreductase family protein [Pseudomonadota bacterium]
MKTTAETHEPLGDFPRYGDAEGLRRALAFFDDIRRRRSVRAFSSKPVRRETIEACLMAAGAAPSGANHQPWYFACIHSADAKRHVRAAAEAEERGFYGGKASQEWLDALAPIGTDASKPYLETAPWLIAVFAQRRGGEEAGQDKKNYYINESVGLATGFFLAALHQAGLATLVHTPKPMGFLNEICERPATEKPFVLVVAGHPADDAMVPKHALKKKALGEIAGFL